MEKVNHPSHYNIPNRKECIVEMLEKFGADKVQIFCELNSYKYKYRHELKNGQEDLDKAAWYEAFAEKLEAENEVHKIAKHYGLPAQFNQMIEEMSELAKAICKVNRMCGLGQPVADGTSMAELELNLIEEIADVKVVLEQIIYLYDAHEIVQHIANKKINRTLERMKKQNESN